MGKPRAPPKAKPAWDKRAAIEKAHTKKLNQLKKLKKLRARLEAEGKAKPLLDVRDNVEALEKELAGSAGSQHTEQPGQQQQPSTSSPHAETSPGAGNDQLPQQHPHQPQPAKQRKRQKQQQQQQLQQLQQQPQENDANGTEVQGQQQQQHEQTGPSHHDVQGEQEGHEGESTRRRQRPAGKHMSKMQKLALQNEARKAEAQKAKEQAQKARAEHQAKLEESKKKRSKEKQKFFKKTKKGQPVMKYRMDKVLSALQKQQQQQQ